MYCTPGPDNSSLINTEKAVPSNPEKRANIRYNVPISFALLDKNQRSHHMDIFDSFGSLYDFNGKSLLSIKLFDSTVL